MKKLREFNGMEIEETKEINGGYWWLRFGHPLLGEMYLMQWEKPQLTTTA
ncbi:hypothetical protein GO009_00030 [Muricauda sp. TY007]|nr:hypothetical protein [Muricauda sp. TY007]NDV14396.1 hypothetical protein [Muricauda sp. TY007]